VTDTTAALIAFGMLLLIALGLVILGVFSNTGSGSKVRDLAKGMRAYRKARTHGERLLVFLWFGRALMRTGYWGAVAAVIAALGGIAIGLFGGNWQIARQILCEAYRFAERMLKGTVTVCAPFPTTNN